MITRELIEKINSLWHKQNTVGLTEAEQEEQRLVRRQYIDEIKGQVRNMLEAIKNPENPSEDESVKHNNGHSCSCAQCKH